MGEWEYRPAADAGLPPGERFRSLKRESGLVSTGLHLAFWSAARGYLRVWHRLEVRGREHLPAAPPFVLVANHTSHLDALVLASPLPWRTRDRVFPLAAGDVFFKTTVHAAFAAGFLNALPVWRRSAGPHALAELRRRLVDEPCGYVLFPEGTRSRDGAMAKFKPGLGMLVAGTAVPVVPCHLDGCARAWPASRWFPRPCRLEVTVGAPLTFADAPNDRGGWEAVAAAAEERVRALAPAR